MRVTISRTVLLFALLGLGACDYFFGSGDKAPLTGERISVLQLDDSLKADPELASISVSVPPPVSNPDWPQAGGTPSHDMQNVALGDNLREAWSSDIGESTSSDRVILAEPVVAEGRIYTMDAQSLVSAFDAANGGRVWQTDLTPEDDDSGYFGGGVAFDKGRIFVSTGFSKAFALDAATGKKIWEKKVPGPVRAAPTAVDGRVFYVTVDNQLIAFDQNTGEQLWTHIGIAEQAGLLGAAAPAVEGDTLIAAYSSGEIFAIRTDNGRVLWSDSLGSVLKSDAVSALADIRGRPVIDKDLVVAVGHSDHSVGIDLRRGGRDWDSDIGGSSNPWVAGDFVFLVTNGNQLVCLTRQEGKIRWVSQLAQYEDEQDKSGPVSWEGPILAGNRLLLTNSLGELAAFDPTDGKKLGSFGLSSVTSLPPIVAGGTLYIVTDSANLVAYR